MNDTGFMCRFEGFGDLLRNGQGFVERDRPLFDPIRQGWAFDEFEDKRTRVAGFFQAVDGSNVRMVE